MSTEDSPGTSRRNLLRGSAVAGGLALGTAMAAGKGGLSPAAAATVTPNITEGTTYYWMDLDGVRGDSTDDKHSHEIDVLSFHFGAASTATVSSKGSGSGKATLKPLTFTKLVDSSTPVLFVACTSGKRFAAATLAMRRSGGDTRDFLRVSLTEVVITSFTQSANYNEVPVESVVLEYAKIKTTFSQPTG